MNITRNPPETNLKPVKVLSLNLSRNELLDAKPSGHGTDDLRDSRSKEHGVLYDSTIRIRHFCDFGMAFHKVSFRIGFIIWSEFYAKKRSGVKASLWTKSLYSQAFDGTSCTLLLSDRWWF